MGKALDVNKRTRYRHTDALLWGVEKIVDSNTVEKFHLEIEGFGSPKFLVVAKKGVATYNQLISRSIGFISSFNKNLLNKNKRTILSIGLIVPHSVAILRIRTESKYSRFFLENNIDLEVKLYLNNDLPSTSCGAGARQDL
jgi:hypothetical protein